MDLSCGENIEVGVVAVESHSQEQPQMVLYAPRDPMLCTDRRIIPNLLALEQMCLPYCDYFQHVQDDILPYMRKVVTTWMLEVCEEQACEEQVFPLAVNYVDRFLCARAISKHQLQLLASAGLLLASKVHQGAPLPVNLLCAYTDNSITAQELRYWELLMLHQLQWQTSAVTALDFVEHVVVRTRWTHQSSLLRRHANTLAALCCTGAVLALQARADRQKATGELEQVLEQSICPVVTGVTTFQQNSSADTDFMHVPPSVTSAACLVAAARGLGALALVAPGGSLVEQTAEDCLATVCAHTSTCPETVERAVQHVEILVTRESNPPKSPFHSNPVEAPGTPTDVQDVLF